MGGTWPCSPHPPHHSPIVPPTGTHCFLLDSGLPAYTLHENSRILSMGSTYGMEICQTSPAACVRRCVGHYYMWCNGRHPRAQEVMELKIRGLHAQSVSGVLTKVAVLCMEAQVCVSSSLSPMVYKMLNLFRIFFAFTSSWSRASHLSSQSLQ